MSVRPYSSTTASASLAAIEAAAESLEPIAGLTGDVVAGTEAGAFGHAVSATDPGDTGVTAGSRVGMRVHKTSGGLLVTMATGLAADVDNVGVTPKVPTGSTYFKYGARLTGATQAEIKACPAGGTITVTNARIRSKSSTPGVVTIYFDVNNDQSTFDNAVDEIVEDFDALASASARPGSNSGPIYQVGQADDDLRVDVTAGDFTVIVEGYTTPAP